MSQIAVAAADGHAAAVAAKAGRALGVILNARGAASKTTADPIGLGGAVSPRVAKASALPVGPVPMADRARRLTAGEGSDVDDRQDR